jgi:Plavaka transposase
MHGVRMFCGDGVAHCCHPILASLPMDYQEQVLATGIKTGLCPCCDIPWDKIGEGGDGYPIWDLNKVLEALSMADGNPAEFKKACEVAGIKPIYHPFWEQLLYIHIFRSITPNILHQLYQGVIQHLIAWLKECCGSAEIDARCQHLPPNHNIQLFMKGISSLSHVTGKEHAQIASILLGLVIGIQLPGSHFSSQLLCAVCGLLDFLYLAQYPMHMTETLKLLHDALKWFHDNKDIFVDLGIRDDFHIPKLHFLDHYIMYIELYGTADNCNTKYTERLHIDLAKDTWDAMNGKDKFPQMMIWLEHHKKISRHAKFISWQTGQ